MKHFFKLVSIVFLLLAISPIALAQKNKVMNLVIGTFDEEGLQVYDFDTETGDVQFKNKVKIKGTCFIAISDDHKHIYTANQENNEGWVSAFEFDPKTAELKLINKVISGGSNPSHITIDQKGVNTIVSHYNSGNVSVLPIQKDGSIGEVIQVVQHVGSSINLPRQAIPHAHSTVFTPDLRYLMVGDLGIDKIMMYNYDASKKTEPLTPASTPFFTEKPGAGTRVMVVHPNKKFIYVNQELTAEVTVYTYNDGILTPIQTVGMVAEGTTGNVRAAADLQLSPDGKFLYASNRGEANELIIYAIDSKTGMLEYKSRQSTLGRMPRYFAIDPTGNYVVVSNMGGFPGGGRGGVPPTPAVPVVIQPAATPPPTAAAPPALSTIIVFKRDKITGALTDTGKKIDIIQPGFLMFVPK